MFFWLMVSKWESASLTSVPISLAPYMLVGSTQLTSTCSRFHCLQNSSKILLYTNTPLSGYQGPAASGWTTVSLWLFLSFCLLPSLISICLNLPVGPRGMSWKLNEAISYNQKVVDTEELLVPRNPKDSYSVSLSPWVPEFMPYTVVNVHLGSWNLSNVSPNVVLCVVSFSYADILSRIFLHWSCY